MEYLIVVVYNPYYNVYVNIENDNFTIGKIICDVKYSRKQNMKLYFDNTDRETYQHH